jgi:hypothetical protein
MMPRKIREEGVMAPSRSSVIHIRTSNTIQTSVSQRRHISLKNRSEMPSKTRIVSSLIVSSWSCYGVHHIEDVVLPGRHHHPLSSTR